MLFLQHSADDPAARLPVSDAAGLYLERALLAPDSAMRLAEVAHALAADQNLANWAIAAAEMRSGRTVNRTDEAAEWLSENLVIELACSICGDNGDSSSSSVDWRLLALLKQLYACDQQQADFERRLEREKLEAMKELAYGASHEINNPLANVAARAQTLLDDEQDPQRRQKLIAIHRQAMRAHEMISDLMLFARPPKLNPTPFSLSELIHKVVGGLSTLAKENNVQLNCADNELSDEINADETQLGVALHALVKNALEAVDEGGSVSVEARCTDIAGEQWVEIMVCDDGPGISADVRRHMFDPFFSGREAGRGLGFGLSKCWRIVTDHGGQTVVRCPAGGGAEVSILLPCANDTKKQHSSALRSS
jgi:signal transduction histidine kinase